VDLEASMLSYKYPSIKRLGDFLNNAGSVSTGGQKATGTSSARVQMGPPLPKSTMMMNTKSEHRV